MSSRRLMQKSNRAPSQTARYDEKQKAILLAATLAFNERGVRGASLTDIAASVGLTTASVTYYYKRKEELAAACFLEGIAAYSKVNQVSLEVTGKGGRVAALIDAHFTLWSDIKRQTRQRPILFDDIRTLSGPVSQPVFDAYTQMFKQLRAFLFADDAPREMSQGDRNAQTHLVLSSLLWLPGWLPNQEIEDYPFSSERIADLLLHGVAAPGWQCSDAAVTIPMPETGPREAFLQAASKQINDHGYHGASVEKISASLNVSKGSFYHHNQNKDELVVDCFELTFATIRQAQNAGRALPCSGLDRLRATCAALVEYQLSSRGPLLRSSALAALPGPSRREMVTRMNRLSDRFASMIADGMVDGSIRPVDPQLGGQLVNPMINGAAELQRWCPQANVDNVTRIYVDSLRVLVNFHTFLSAAKCLASLARSADLEFPVNNEFYKDVCCSSSSPRIKAKSLGQQHFFWNFLAKITANNLGDQEILRGKQRCLSASGTALRRKPISELCREEGITALAANLGPRALMKFLSPFLSCTLYISTTTSAADSHRYRNEPTLTATS
jgi:AcrR family transcriptional regulator